MNNKLNFKRVRQELISPIMHRAKRSWVYEANNEDGDLIFRLYQHYCPSYGWDRAGYDWVCVDFTGENPNAMHGCGTLKTAKYMAEKSFLRSAK